MATGRFRSSLLSIISSAIKWIYVGTVLKYLLKNSFSNRAESDRFHCLRYFFWGGAAHHETDAETRQPDLPRYVVYVLPGLHMVKRED